MSNPQEPLQTSVEIFRRAMDRSAEIQQQSLDDMRKQTDEVHERLKAITFQRFQQPVNADYAIVVQAIQLDPAFWTDTVLRAKAVLEKAKEPAVIP